MTTAGGRVDELKPIAEGLNECHYRMLLELTTDIAWKTAGSGEVESELPGWSDFTGQNYKEMQGWGWPACRSPRRSSAHGQRMGHRGCNQVGLQDRTPGASAEWRIQVHAGAGHAGHGRGWRNRPVDRRAHRYHRASGVACG